MATQQQGGGGGYMPPGTVVGPDVGAVVTPPPTPPRVPGTAGRARDWEPRNEYERAMNDPVRRRLMGNPAYAQKVMEQTFREDPSYYEAFAAAAAQYDALRNQISRLAEAGFPPPSIDALAQRDPVIQKAQRLYQEVAGFAGWDNPYNASRMLGGDWESMYQRAAQRVNPNPPPRAASGGGSQGGIPSAEELARLQEQWRAAGGVQSMSDPLYRRLVGISQARNRGIAETGKDPLTGTAPSWGQPGTGDDTYRDPPNPNQMPKGEGSQLTPKPLGPDESNPYENLRQSARDHFANRSKGNQPSTAASVPAPAMAETTEGLMAQPLSQMPMPPGSVPASRPPMNQTGASGAAAGQMEYSKHNDNVTQHARKSYDPKRAMGAMSANEMQRRREAIRAGGTGVNAYGGRVPQG